MNKIILLLLPLWLVFPSTGMSQRGTPKLVIGIQIDQLRGDYLTAFSEGFSPKGLKRILKEGKVFKNGYYDFPHPDIASSVATIQTGSTPNKHGIVGDDFFSIEDKQIKKVVSDDRFIGYYTSERVSPYLLNSSTIGDEIKVATNGQGKVFSIAPDAPAALLSAGHGADGGFWLDNRNGEWAGSTYYNNAPFWLIGYNDAKAPILKVDSMQWEPLHPASFYKYLPFSDNPFSFSYHYKREPKERMQLIKTSPIVNQEMTELAIEVLSAEKMGKDNYPDLLVINYFAGNYKNQPVVNAPMEIQDIYFRLDKNITQLVAYIEKNIGLENVLFYITSTGYFNAEGSDPERFRIPTGEFHPDRCTALLNIYLMAIYGQGQWVLGYHDRQIFLNRKLIEESKISLKEMQTTAADFAIQFSGIQDVSTSQQLIHSGWNNFNNSVKNGFHRKHSGDLLLDLQPGWKIVLSEKSGESYQYNRHSVVTFPIIYFGGGISGGSVDRRASVSEIAPAVCRQLKIRTPNDASAYPPAELEE